MFINSFSIKTNPFIRIVYSTFSCFFESMSFDDIFRSTGRIAIIPSFFVTWISINVFVTGKTFNPIF